MKFLLILLETEFRFIAETNALTTSILEVRQNRDSPPEGAVGATGSIQRRQGPASGPLTSESHRGKERYLHYSQHPLPPAKSVETTGETLSTGPLPNPSDLVKYFQDGALGEKPMSNTNGNDCDRHTTEISYHQNTAPSDHLHTQSQR